MADLMMTVDRANGGYQKICVRGILKRGGDMPKDKSGKKAGADNRISIKAELLDEVLKDCREPQDCEIHKSRGRANIGSGVNPASRLRQGQGQAGASNPPPKRI
jgi:hypothetical protein